MKKALAGVIVVVVAILIVFNYCIDEDKFTLRQVDYNGDNLKISIDGVEANVLPTSGTYYLVDYDCKNANTKVSWDKDSYELNISNSNDGVSCNLDFQSQPLLAQMPIGSYVAYVGNNGCLGDSCKGENANYVSDQAMGYCGNGSYQFTTSGWRIGYVEDGNVNLVSAGAVDCLCSNSDGSTSSSNCNSEVSTKNVDVHKNNIDNIALKYCNTTYANGSVCNSDTAWGLDVDDLEKMLKNASLDSCFGVFGNKSCGYTNDLIDNGGYYWINGIQEGGNKFYTWIPAGRVISSQLSFEVRGVRPVVKLNSSVIVTGGTGTYDDPYIIDNNSFEINLSSDNDFGFDVNGDKLIITDKKNIVLNLNGGVDVSTMCISVGTSGCSNYVKFSSTYPLDLSNEEDGEVTIYAYYKNSSGDVVASLNKNIILDTVGPIDNSITIGGNSGVTRTLILKSTDAEYMCFSNTSSNPKECVDWVDYDTSYAWTLSDGEGKKIVYAFFKDEAGNVGEVVSDTVTIVKECLGIGEIFKLEYTGKGVSSNGLDVKLCAGTYTMELWGAQGGNAGGHGGYSVGDITLTGMETLYFYVGGVGAKGRAGFNGGGTTGSTGGGGGGATDVRVGTDSLYARVIVAGGGGGKGKDSCALGGAGGGELGIGGNLQDSCGTQGGAGSQTAGGIVGGAGSVSGANAGSFGIGGDALDSFYDGGAGGGGWYGGGAGASADWSNGGGGGSGFVWTADSVVPSGYLVSSDYYLENASTIAGDQSIPNVNGNSTEIGHSSNGYIKITRLS